MAIKLTAAQEVEVKQWVAEGKTISQVQQGLLEKYGIQGTFLDVRCLIDDIGAAIVEKEEPKKEVEAAKEEIGEATVLGEVDVWLDKVMRAGALVSGGVRFSDGNKCTWHLDQYGRLGLVPEVSGYKPTPEDVKEFQQQLQGLLQEAGY